jgi:hypothetical protein
LNRRAANFKHSAAEAFNGMLTTGIRGGSDYVCSSLGESQSTLRPRSAFVGISRDFSF